MEYNYIKSLHLIFVITWFAGLFYIPRLFVYQIEAFHKPSPDKEIIAWPSAVLATLFAIWLLILVPSWLEQGWMHVKLAFVVLLFLYHYKTHIYFKQLQNDIVKVSSNYMRIWNEGATFILFAVVFLVILKSSINWIFGVIGIIVLGILLMLGFRLYKNIRSKNPEA